MLVLGCLGEMARQSIDSDGFLFVVELLLQACLREGAIG